MAKVDSLSLSVFEVARLLKQPAAEVLQRAKRKPPPSNPRTKSYRKRKRLGRAIGRIEYDELGVAEYLIDTRRLTPSEALIRARVDQALSQVVADLVARWKKRDL
jgi:hypothetical protein